MPPKRPSIFYIDFLRFVAATAVVMIHLIGPFRELYGQIPTSDWLAAVSINASTRWAVPLFMMISGALLLSSRKPFEAKSYMVKRLSKVAIPFLGWSLIYAAIQGIMGEGFPTFVKVLAAAPNDPTWYHLWFFYDFIPLYFVIPFFVLLLRWFDREHITMLLFVFATLFLMKWLRVESFLLKNLILYTGYLFLGWYLFNRDNSKELRLWVVAGVSMIALNIVGTYLIALETGKYSSFFMGYKTLNTALIGGMLFVLGQHYAERIRGRWRSLISLVAKYSLGIYLVHPIFLIPVRNLDNGFYAFFGSNWIAIPALTVIVMALSLWVTMFLARFPYLRRLVP